MNRYTFSTQKGKAYYCNSIPGFINECSESIVGQLVRHSFEVGKEQTDAWENQITELQKRIEQCGMDGDIIFEYDIVRLGKWMRRNKEEQKRHLVNSYRVLMTRARQGMVIYVPNGVDAEEDETRNHEYYDDIYEYLLRCGIKDLF